MKSVLHSCKKSRHFLTRMVAVVGAIGYNHVFGAIDLFMFSRKGFYYGCAVA